MMKAFKIGILLASMVLEVGAHADEGELIECKAHDGKTVQYLAADADYLRIMAYSKFALSDMKSWSLVDNKLPADFPFPDLNIRPYLNQSVVEIPILLLDVDSMQKTPVEFQNFVIHHECAHHQHGDVALEKKVNEMTRRISDLDRELRADCMAIESLVKNPHFAYDDSQIQTIMKTMKDEFEKSSVKKDINGKVIRKGIFKYYGPVEDRNKALYQCFMNVKAAIGQVTKGAN